MIDVVKQSSNLRVKMNSLIKVIIFLSLILLSLNSQAQSDEVSIFDLAGDADLQSIKKLITKTNKSELVEILNKQDRRKRTPLIMATILSADEHGNLKQKNAQVIQLLLKNGADPFIQDKRGRTALEYAVKDENKKLVVLFLENTNYSDEMINEIIENWEEGMDDPSIIDELKIYKASRLVSKSFIEKCPHMISEDELPGMTKVLTEFSRTITDITVTAAVDDMQKIICKNKGRDFRDAIFDLHNKAKEANSLFNDIENAPAPSSNIK